MEMKPIIERAEAALLHTYNRYQIVLDHGDGMYLYDTEGKEYLDFYSGIAVYALGYHYPGLDEAMKTQMDKLLHTSNYFYNVPAVEAAEKLKKVSGMDRVFFTNSGTEAIEGAVKLARRYAYDKDGSNDHEIIAMKHSFHGRSMGALSVTGNAHYQDPFKPLISGVKFADFNDLDSVKALFNDKTCAIILEPLQGEGGIYPATEEFLKGVEAICKENDILLILDEIQCGMGRTGRMFYHQQFGVEPDVLTVAKALGNGLPVGAFLCKESCAALVAGDHGTTYGGNPMVCAAASKILDIFEEDHILDNCKETGKYLWDALEALKSENAHIIGHRGAGLMQGLEFDQPVGSIIQKAMDEGVILINAGPNIIRFLPALIAKPAHVDEMVEKLKKAMV